MLTRREALRRGGMLGALTVSGCTGAPGRRRYPPLYPSSPIDPRDAGAPPSGAFRHGVASGDPLSDAVLLWTRVTGDETEVSVEWEVSAQPDFVEMVARGSAMTDASRDFTVKVDATGLSSATTYYYRFRLASTGELSETGRMRTAPAADGVARLRFAVCCCASYPHGYFHGYRNIAARADLDAVVHLGDYLYEYANGQYADGAFPEIRPVDPPHELLTLEHYRRRYAQYRSDPDLREAHRQHPWITIWDDHEIANDAWSGGAQNHMPEEGSYPDRRAAAQQAYSEWMPIRTVDPARIFRSLRFGDLAEIILLDTRIEGRTEKFVGDPAQARLMSEEQEAFLGQALTGSTSRWKVLAQQVMFSPLPLLAPYDTWEDYAAQRARIFDVLRTGGPGGGAIEGVVVLSGDMHSSWAIDVTENPFVATPRPVGVELVVPGITSPSLFTADNEEGLRLLLPEHAPHVRFYDLSNRGYLIVDLEAEKAQGDFVFIRDVTAPYDASEIASGSWRVRAGERRLERAAGPTAAPSNPPPLAP